MIVGIKDQVDEVQRLFVENKDVPPVASNLPPISVLYMEQGLGTGNYPIEKLKMLDKKILEREDTRDMLKVYTALIGMMADFDREKVEAWGETIEESSQAKLKNSLLRRVAIDSTQTSLKVGSKQTEMGNLSVNFDPLLIKLLREVKYFLLLGLNVPTSAMEIYQKVEIFRRHTET